MAYARAAHARGILLNGTFTPTSEASALSVAPHFNGVTTPVTVRFSSSTGLPQLPDTDQNGEPRGMAIRFNLGEHRHTDIIAHSTPHFPTRTGEEFLELLRAIAASPAGTPSPSLVEQFLGSHPAALAFVQAPKPITASFATTTYWGLNAHLLVDAEGKQTPFRYQIHPVAGDHKLDDAAVKEKSPHFLLDEIKKRVSISSVELKVVAQIGEEGDVTDDVTVHWPDDRRLVELGTVRLDSLEKDDAKLQKRIIFDPIARVDGIKASDDPLLEMRAAVYLISGKGRRAD